MNKRFKYPFQDISNQVSPLSSGAKNTLENARVYKEVSATNMCWVQRPV